MKRDWAAARAKVNREGQCRVCGRATPYLEAAHVVPRSIGGRQSADSIIPLCPEDHRLYDSLQIDLLGYLTREEEVEAVRVLGIERARRRLAPQTYAHERVA